MNASNSTEETAFGDCRNNNESRLSASFGAGFGQDISVPVYATIKGVRKIHFCWANYCGGVVVSVLAFYF